MLESNRHSKDALTAAPSRRKLVASLAASLKDYTTHIASSMTDQTPHQIAEDHYYAALDHVAEGDHERALAEYQLSLDSDPVFVEAMHGMARALQDLNRLDEAIAVAQRITAIDPDDILAHTSLSVCYQKKGMIPEAEAEGNKARILGWKQQLTKPSS